MKKFLVSILLLFVFAVTLPLSVSGQSCRKSYRNRGYNGYYNGYPNRNYRSYNRGYNRRAYRNAYYGQPYYRTAGYYNNGGYYQRPSFYRRHRNLINLGIGTGGGALLGGLLGGRRGIGWGALAGAGASALYTYKIRPKQRRY